MIDEDYAPDDTLTLDQKRIAAVMHIIDGVGDLDVHELAGQSAIARGDEIADERDYYVAGCKLLDAARGALTVSGD